MSKRYNLQELRRNRVKKNYTQRQLADAIGISESYYCQLENGTRRMSLPIAQKIAIVLNKDMDSLFMPDNLAYREDTDKTVAQ